jgi:N-methylhydantoinase A/oxoprolinase/acetone carboxylase beta subunit
MMKKFIGIIPAALMLSAYGNIMQARQNERFKSALWGAYRKINCSFNEFVATRPENYRESMSEKNFKASCDLSRDIVYVGATIASGEQVGE